MRNVRLFLCLWASVLGVGCMTPNLELTRSVINEPDAEEQFMAKHHHNLDEMLKALNLKRSQFEVEKRADGGWDYHLELKHILYNFAAEESGKVWGCNFTYDPFPGPSVLDRILGINVSTVVRSNADLQRIVAEEKGSYSKVMGRLRLQGRDLEPGPGGFPVYQVWVSTGRFVFGLDHPKGWFGMPLNYNAESIISYASFIPRAEDEAGERVRKTRKERR